MAQSARGKPFALQGVRILDFSWFLASAGGTKFLAALGAESIKVEWKDNPDTRLSVQQCRACSDRHFPGSPVCPNCLSSDQQWEPVSGRGTLQSWVAFHRAYWPGFASELPYDVCLVQLEEGPLMVSNLVDGPAGAHLGAPVQVMFERVDDTFALPKWTLRMG